MHLSKSRQSKKNRVDNLKGYREKLNADKEKDAKQCDPRNLEGDRSPTHYIRTMTETLPSQRHDEVAPGSPIVEGAVLQRTPSDHDDVVFETSPPQTETRGDDGNKTTTTENRGGFLHRVFRWLGF